MDSLTHAVSEAKSGDNDRLGELGSGWEGFDRHLDELFPEFDSSSLIDLPQAA